MFFFLKWKKKRYYIFTVFVVEVVVLVLVVVDKLTSLRIGVGWCCTDGASILDVDGDDDVLLPPPPPKNPNTFMLLFKSKRNQKHENENENKTLLAIEPSSEVCDLNFAASSSAYNGNIRGCLCDDVLFNVWMCE